MARQEIILGAAPTGFGGDPPRTASSKINAMTTEIYNKFTAANIGVTNSAAFVGVNLNPDNYITGGQILGQFVILGIGITGYLQVFPGSDSSLCGQIFMDASSGGLSTRKKASGVWSRWEVITGLQIYAGEFNIDNVDPVLGSVDRFFSTPETTGTKPFNYGWVRTMKFLNSNNHQVAYEAVTGSRVATRTYTGQAGWTAWSIQYGTSNTTRAADGTLKAI